MLSFGRVWGRLPSGRVVPYRSDLVQAVPAQHWSVLRFAWLVVALALLVVQSASGEIRGAREEQVRGHLSDLPIPSTKNSRQTDSAVAYCAPAFADTVVTRDGQIVYSLPGVKASTSSARSSGSSGGWSLTETLVGGRARPVGSDPASSGVSYMIGNYPARWRSGLEILF